MSVEESNKMVTSKQFNMSSILSITTHVLFGDMEEIYTILNFMTGDSLQTTQLPAACDECSPRLYEQHPWLLEVDKALAEWPREHDGKTELIAYPQRFVVTMENKYGKMHEVFPLHPEDHEQTDPLTAARDRGFTGEVISVDVEKPSEYGDINWKTDHD